MKRFRLHLILAFAILLIIIMPFSIVQGDTPVVVRNQATMTKPYETGDRDTFRSSNRAQSSADYDLTNGITYAYAFASRDSNAWANSSLEDAFEIIHSSNYRITFSIDYHGLVEIIGYDNFDTASAKVDLKVYLIDRSSGNIVRQETETVYSRSSPFLQPVSDEPTGSSNLVLTAPLVNSHIYDWRAELWTEAMANDNLGDDLEVTVDFFDSGQGYGAEVVHVFVEDLNPDSTPPTTTASLLGTEGENGWYTSSVTVSLGATDVGYGIENTTYRINSGLWTLYNAPFIIDVEGTNTIEYYSVDQANNKENTKTLDIKIDTTQPTGQVTINNDDNFAGSEVVMLYNTADDGGGSGLYQMRFRNDGDVWVDSWIAYTTEPTPWTLITGDGNKRVYVQFKDNAGNISPTTSDSIILDTEPPTTTASLSGPEGENDWYIGDVTITLSASDTSSGVGYTTYRINGEPWKNYNAPFIIDVEGTNTIEYYSVDQANNKENTKTLDIKIDTTQPTGQVTINNDDDYTSTTLVTLSLTYEDAASGVSEVRYSNDGVWDTEVWENPTQTKYWTLTLGEGIKKVYYQLKDNAGNISPITSDSIILDTEPPSATISINEGDEYTNSTSVTLYLQYSDNEGIDQVRYSNDGISYTNWEQPSETKSWTLLSEDGIKTVYAQIRDRAGLNSNFVSDTIILDTTPPTGSIEINNGASSTTSTSVTITPSATDANGVNQMRLRNNIGDWSDWTEVSIKTWTLTSGFGLKTVFAQFKDNTGLISSEFAATINLVESEPSPTPTSSPTPSEIGNVIIFVKYENNDPAYGATVTTIAMPSGQSSLKGITDSNGVVTFNNIIIGSYSFHGSKGIYGSNNVQAIVKSQQTISVNITLVEDLTEPVIAVALTTENSGILQRIFSVTAEDDIQGSGISTVTLYIDENPVKTWTTAGTHIYDEGFYSNGKHTYYVEAVDNAGNIVREPVSGYLEFTVEEGTQIDQMELWKLMSIILVLVGGSILAMLSIKMKK